MKLIGEYMVVAWMVPMALSQMKYRTNTLNINSEYNLIAKERLHESFNDKYVTTTTDDGTFRGCTFVP
ncbi:hypothetical protein GCM10008022_11080 [Paenibacillus hunanensis]|nr:hypothetical protein GCM10008022_11080 [Paenibacillus hunanensis]